MDPMRGLVSTRVRRHLAWNARRSTRISTLRGLNQRLYRLRGLLSAPTRERMLVRALIFFSSAAWEWCVSVSESDGDAAATRAATTAVSGPMSVPTDAAENEEEKRRRVRTKCYRGTFIEKDNRVNKQRLEEIPCDSDLRTKKYAKLRAKPAPRAKAKKYSTGLPGLPPPKRKRK